jgi:hypothetical protein
MTIDVRRGRNEFQFDATDPETGKHAEQKAMVVITVPISQVQAPTMTVDQPADGTTFENGAIPVQGTAQNATSVKIVATYDGPVTGAPTPSAAPSASPAVAGPPEIMVPVAADGAWDTGTSPLQLTTGRWTITVTASNEQRSSTQTRHVAVAYKGINLVVKAKGGPAWIKVWVDGKIDPKVGRGGRLLRDGQTLTFSGATSVEVRTGSSGATTFTLNGQSLGALGRRGIPETWLFKPPAAPTPAQRQ